MNTKQKIELKKMYDQWQKAVYKNHQQPWYQDLCYWDIHEQLVQLGYAEAHPNPGLFTVMSYRITSAGIQAIEGQA